MNLKVELDGYVLVELCDTNLKTLSDYNFDKFNKITNVDSVELKIGVVDPTFVYSTYPNNYFYSTSEKYTTTAVIKSVSTGSGASFTISAIDNAAGTSWLGDNYDPALLYGAMREAMLFMKGEQDLVTYYEQKYQEAIGQLKRLGDGLERNDAYRSGQTSLQYNKL